MTVEIFGRRVFRIFERLETQHKVAIIVALIAFVGTVLGGLLGGPAVGEIVKTWLNRPTATVTATATPTTSPTLTTTPTSTPTATRIPDDQAAIMSLVDDEARAVLERDRDLLQRIYDRSGEVCDTAGGQCRPFLNHYDTLWASEAGVFTETRHENFTITEIENHPTVTNDSCGRWQGTGAQYPELWGNIKGDHWELAKIDGRWKIIRLSINNPLTTFVTYDFEDGTLGCWNLSEEGGRSLGFGLTNTGERSYSGARSLKFNVDLQGDGEHRGRIEHRTSQPIPPITRMSAWVFYAPTSEPGPLVAEFFVWERGGTWHVTPTTDLIPNQWTEVSWDAASLHPGNPQTPVQMLGLEVKISDSASASQRVIGVIFVDELVIR